MYGIIVILALVLIYNCRDMIPEKIKEWWENSNLKSWVYPIFAILLTVAIVVGIHYEILNWGAIAIPMLFGLPYIWGMILGLWHNMKGAGHKLTSKDDVEAKEIAIQCLKKLGCQPEVNKDGSLGSDVGRNKVK